MFESEGRMDGNMSDRRNGIVIIIYCMVVSAMITFLLIMSVGRARQTLGIAGGFSNHARKISIIQADQGEVFTNQDFLHVLHAEESEDKAMILAKSNPSGGVELYAPEMIEWNLLSQVEDGVLLRDDYVDSLLDDSGALYYKGHNYSVAGVYNRSRYNEKFIVNYLDVLKNHPTDSVKGIFFLDVGDRTDECINRFMDAIITINKSAVIVAEEGNINQNVVKQVVNAGDSAPFTVLAVLLLLFNFLSFATLAGYWTKSNVTEIYVRRLSGGSKVKSFFGLWLFFGGVTFFAVLLGTGIGTLLCIMVCRVPWNEGMIIGIILNGIQWLVLWLFIAGFLVKTLQLSPAALGRTR